MLAKKAAFLLMLVVALALSTLNTVVAQSEETAHVRVSHQTEEVGAVDIYINDELSAITGLNFGTTTDYVEVPAGAYVFGVAPAGEDPTLTMRTFLAPGSWVTVAAVTAPGGRPTLTRINEINPEQVARLRVAHNNGDVGAVDIFINGALTNLTGVEFGTISPWLEVAGGEPLTIGVAPAGGTPEFTLNTRVEPGSWTTITALLAPGSGRPTLAKTTESAFVRVAHLSAEAPNVDVIVDGAVSALTDVAAGTISDWIELPLGAHTFAIAPTGDTTPVSTLQTSLQAGTWTTVAAVTRPDGRVELRRIVEDYTLFDRSKARVTVIHAIPDAPPVNVQLANGPFLIQGLGYPGSLGDNDGVTTLDVDPGAYNLWVVPSNNVGLVLFDLAGTTLEAGNSYLVAAYGSFAEAQITSAGANIDAVAAQ